MPTTIVPIGGEPTFYLNDLAETARVGVSGERPVSEMDERPEVTYNVDGVINTLTAAEVQKWFQFIGGKASTDETYPNGGYAGDVMFGVKSNTDCAFTDIPAESPNNTTLRFHQYNLQNDYLGTLAETVFGYAEGANLFSNVPELKDSYNGALVEVIAKTNALMNDISHTLVNGVDVTKKLANTILKKYPERFELKFGAKIYTDSDNVPNGHLGYDTTKTPGVNQTTSGWVFHRVANDGSPVPQTEKAEATVTLSDQNTIVDMILTKEGNGYQFGDRLILCQKGQFGDQTQRFVEFPSILDVQANTLNQSGNNEDVLFSTTDPKGADSSGNVQNFLRDGNNAYITNRLFLPGVTSDATVVCMDYVADANGLVTGTGSTVDVSCTPTGSYTDNSSAAVFEEMTVTKRGGDLRYNAYAEGNTLTVSKNNATITHTLTATDAVRLNLGVLTIDSGKVIDSSAVFNNDSSGIVVGYNVSDNTTIRGTGAIVDVNTDNLGTDICYNGVDGIPHIIVSTTGSGYEMNDRIRITNQANPTQTIDLSLTRMDANFLNGLTILNIIDLSATITTRSMFSTDGKVPETILCRVTTSASSASGAIAEVHVGNNGTWVKKITVRDGSYNSPVAYADTDTIVLTNMNGNVSETIELSGTIVDASFIQALNAGEEYILTAPGDVEGTTSLTDSSNALTHSLTGGIVFDNGETNSVVSYEDVNGNAITSGGGSGATVYVTTTGTYFQPPVVEIEVLSPGSGYVEGDMIRITRNYQTVVKKLTVEDAALLNGEPKEIRGVDDLRTITSAPIFTDGAFGYATSANSTGPGALIRVDTDINDTTLVRLTVMIPDSGEGFQSGDVVIIQNIEDPTQHITFTLAAEITPSQDELELNNTDSKVLAIQSTDIPYLFKGGVTKSVRAVKNGIDNKYSEAIVDITCDGSPDGNPDVGAKIEYITVASPAKPGTVGSQDELYYMLGDTVTFTVNENGESINRSVAINQSVDGVASTIGSTFSIKYVITIDSLTQEQADVLNGILVGVNVPLLPGDVLAIKSTIESPAGVQDQPQFVQSFITKYSLR